MATTLVSTGSSRGTSLSCSQEMALAETRVLPGTLLIATEHNMPLLAKRFAVSAPRFCSPLRTGLQLSSDNEHPACRRQDHHSLQPGDFVGPAWSSGLACGRGFALPLFA